MRYAEAADLQRLTQTDIDTDTAELLLDMVGARIDEIACRPLTAEERTETIPVAGDTLWLDWPLHAVAEIDAGDGPLTEGTDYRWARSGWVLWVGQRPQGEVTVTFTAGFEPGSIQIEAARTISLEVAADVAANPQALRQFSADSTSMTFGAGLDLTEEQRDRIRRWQSRRKRA